MPSGHDPRSTRPLLQALNMTDLAEAVGQRIRLRLTGSPFTYVGVVQRYGARGQFIRVRVEAYERGDQLQEYSFRATPRSISAWERIE